MLRLLTMFKRTIVAVGLVSLAVVLFPNQTEPLWQWGQSLGQTFGNDPLPSFPVAQFFSGIILLIFTLGGVTYNLWRDRRFEILQAEYSHKTGANHLREKVSELENRVEELTGEHTKLQKQHEALNKEHTSALVKAKEHEVRSQYGQEAQVALKDLRAQFEILLREKGHTKGFREAVELMVNQLPQTADVTMQQSRQATNSRGNGDRRALPFGAGR